MPSAASSSTDATAERVRALLDPVLADDGFELVDVVLHGGVLQVLVELAHDPDDLLASARIDLDGVAAATHLVNEALDAADPIPGSYTLEVSSPGLERPLRTPAHFRRFVGRTVNVKTKPDVEGDRRIEGTLADADPDATGAITVAGRRIAYADVERARTVFEWGPQPKPGGPKGKGKAKPPTKPTQNAQQLAPAEVPNEGEPR